MREAVGEYTDWRSVSYNPAIAELLPRSLLPYLSPGQTVLDIGCNTGGVSLFLASHGLTVSGIDLNEAAIHTANKRAEAAGLGSHVHFKSVDVLQAPCRENFDAVLLIRFLTCFPSLHNWRSLLKQTNSFLKRGGIIYIHDFKISEESRQYGDRYAAGARLGWRTGNFAVNDKAGNLLFIAHHHSADEINEMTSPYLKLELNFHTSLSMNGNECEMFEFIGRKL
jgi:ubiquinone/menaquinone biosynthesis C-methylase UbiE